MFPSPNFVSLCEFELLSFVHIHFISLSLYVPHATSMIMQTPLTPKHSNASFSRKTTENEKRRNIKPEILEFTAIHQRFYYNCHPNGLPVFQISMCVCVYIQISILSSSSFLAKSKELKFFSRNMSRCSWKLKLNQDKKNPNVLDFLFFSCS